MARQPYERREFSVKVSFVREKGARECAARVAPAWNPGIFEGVLSVDERTVIFRRRARELAPDRAILSVVDSGGQVDIL
jgi:hypothetical protein